MFKPAFDIFRLHELPFSHFTFPRWQAWLALVAIGLWVGLDPAMRQASPDMPAMPLWAGPAFSVVLILLCFPLIILFLTSARPRSGKSSISWPPRTRTRRRPHSRTWREYCRRWGFAARDWRFPGSS